MHIYRMRVRGELASRDVILKLAASGWLDFRRVPPGAYGPSFEARLLDSRGGRDRLPPLYWARILRIDGVLHLVGKEDCGRPNIKARPDMRYQSWLCASDPAAAAPFIARVKEEIDDGYGYNDLPTQWTDP
ncbi:MAG: hypothetical protein EON54_03745 [Alcaligenaceae bacterium]|nr:MAG: hypothetical protein EON54_03745 [Alcaligenaceae bacterium]